MLSVMLLGADVSMAAVGHGMKKNNVYRYYVSALTLLQSYLRKKTGKSFRWTSRDPTFSRVDHFVVSHHVLSYNRLRQLARGQRTES